MKKTVLGIILAGIVIGIFVLAFTNPNLVQSKQQWFGTVDVGKTQCSGEARCITGTVTRIIDGDTIVVGAQSIRFALASAPEMIESGGQEAKDYIQMLCPTGSSVLIDEDDGQQEGSYGRILGVIYCNGHNLNAKLLDSANGYLSKKFCSQSEFGVSDWAKRHGC